VRNRQITPSNCSRSRSGYGPYSPIGRNGSINFHCLLVSCLRVTIVFLPDPPSRRIRIGKIDHDVTQVLVESRAQSIDTGMTRLRQHIVNHRHLPLPQLCTQLAHDLGDPRDDLTLIAARTPTEPRTG
jgi:hypothetical protein